MDFQSYSDIREVNDSPSLIGTAAPKTSRDIRSGKRNENHWGWKPVDPLRGLS